MRHLTLIAMSALLALSMLASIAPASADEIDDALLYAELAQEVADNNAGYLASQPGTVASCDFGQEDASCGGSSDANIACALPVAKGVVEPARTVLGTVTVHPRDVLVGGGVCTNPDVTAAGGVDEYTAFVYWQETWYDRETRTWHLIGDGECQNGSVLGQAPITCQQVQAWGDPLDARQYEFRKAYFQIGFYDPDTGQRVVRAEAEALPLPANLKTTIKPL